MLPFFYVYAQAGSFFFLSANDQKTCVVLMFMTIKQKKKELSVLLFSSNNLSFSQLETHQPPQ